MRLSIKALAFAGGILWGAALLFAGLANLIWPGYAQEFLAMAASVYPGYEATRSIGNVIVGTVYALVDGAVCGAILAWLYNRFASPVTR